MFDLAGFIDQKYEWSKETFGEGLRTRGVLEHIAKELLEIRASPTELEEWVDVILLALDGASRAGHSGCDIETALIAKQMINVMRQWPKREQPEHLPVEHIKTKIETPYDGGEL